MCSANNSKRELRDKVEEPAVNAAASSKPHGTSEKRQVNTQPVPESAPLESTSSDEIFYMAEDHLSIPCLDDDVSTSVQSVLNKRIESEPVKNVQFEDNKPRQTKSDGCSCKKPKDLVLPKPSEPTKTSSEIFYMAEDHLSNLCLNDHVSASVLNKRIESEPAKYVQFEHNKPRQTKSDGCSCKKPKDLVLPKPIEPIKTCPARKPINEVKYAHVEDDKSKQTKFGRCYCKKPKDLVLPRPKVCPTLKPSHEVIPNYTSESATQICVVQSNCKQNIGIKIAEITPTFSSGTINIPIHFDISINAAHLTPVKKDTTGPPPEKRKPASEKKSPPTQFLFQTCSNLDYMECYMDEILDEQDVNICHNFMSTQLPKQNTKMVFTSYCTDYYAEPYVKTGFADSQEDVQRDDIASKVSPSSMKSSNSKYCTDNPHLSTNLNERSDSGIRWEDVVLPRKETIKISPEKHEEPEVEEVASTSKPSTRSAVADKNPKKKKSGGCFSCCSSSDEDLDLEPEQHIDKSSLVYGQHCLVPEPYNLALLRQFPDEKTSDSPCSSKPEIPWATLILPQDVKIRPVFKMEQIEPSKSLSAPCLCISDKNDSNTRSEQSIKPASTKSSVTFKDTQLVMLYPPPDSRIPSRLPAVSCESSSYKPEFSKKNDPMGVIKATLGGKSKSDHGTMRTKVTLSGKDLTRLFESQGKIKSSVNIEDSTHQKLSSRKICSSSNEMKMSSSRSTPVLNKSLSKVTSYNASAQRSTNVVNVDCKAICNSQTGMKSDKLSSASLGMKQDPVLTAFIACEAELKPVKQALNKVQEKLRNMNMPELDSIFSKGTQLANEFLNKRNRNNIVSGFGTATVNHTNMNVMNDRIRTYYPPPISAYPATYMSPSQSNTYMQPRPRPYPNVEVCPYASAPYYGQYSSPSNSGVSSCAPSTHNFPNYDRNYQYPAETNYSSSSFRRSDPREKHSTYNRDQSEDWRNRSDHSCCCSSSKYGDDRRLYLKRSDDELSYSSSSSPSEGSSRGTRRSRKRNKKTAVRKCKSKNSAIVSQQSLCPFLEALQSILIMDKKKVVKKGSNGTTYDTKLSTKKIKNMRVHMRVRTSKKGKFP